MGQKSLDAAQTIDMLQAMASETSDQNGQFAGFSSWMISQHLQSGGRLSSGKTATAIANFWSEAHGPFLNLLRDVMDDFSNKLEQIQNAISDAFTSEAVLKELFMMDQLYDELDQLKNVVRNFGDALADIKNEYSDVLAMPSFDDSKIEQGLTKSQEKLQETTAYLYEMDAKMKTPMEYIAEDIALMHTYVDRIRSMISNGSVSIENFSRGQIKDEEAYKNMKSAWTERNLHNTMEYINLFLGKPFGVFDNYILGTVDILSGAAIGLSHYANTGKVSFKPKSIVSSHLSMYKNSAKIIDKFTNIYNGAKSVAKNSIEAGYSRIAQNTSAQKFSDIVKKVESKVSLFTESKVGKFLGPVGVMFTGLSHVDELTSPDNRDKTQAVKAARFITGVAVEAGGAALGASIGAAVLAPVPGGPIIGAVIGGIVGGEVAGKAVDYVKDGAEYVVSGQMLDDMRRVGNNVVSAVSNTVDSVSSVADDLIDNVKTVASDVGDAVEGFFSNAADSVSGWFR
ncbi:hypothetical protein EIJ82_09905 [Alkalihalobacillus clausii]|nr:hypothetical protein [Shouchella clausii]